MNAETHSAISRAIVIKAKHLQSHLVNTGHGQRSEDWCFEIVGKLRLDLEPLAKIKAMTMPRLVNRLREAGLFRG